MILQTFSRSTLKIAGIGVRGAVYTQAFLAAVHSAVVIKSTIGHDHDNEQEVSLECSGDTSWFIAFPDPRFLAGYWLQNENAGTRRRFLQHYCDVVREFHARSSYFNVLKNVEWSLFMVGGTLIIYAIVQWTSNGLTPYHALIVLNVSMINNWAGLLILFTRSAYSRPFRFFREAFWCMAHCMIFCAFGLYFWTRQDAFQGYVPEQSAPCRHITHYWVFGPVLSTNQTLKTASLAFYFISILPIIGLVFQACIPAIVPLLFIFTLRTTKVGISRVPEIIGQILPTTHFVRGVIRPSERLRVFLVSSFQSFLAARYPTSVLGRFDAGLTLVHLSPIAAIVYTVVATELMIRLNAPNVYGEGEWSYGQTFTSLTALVSAARYGNALRKALRKQGKMMLEANTSRPTETRGKGSLRK